jgi:hypothetical protein
MDNPKESRPLERVATYPIQDSQRACSVIPCLHGRYGGMRWVDHIQWRFVSELWRSWKKDIHTVRQERGSGFR